MNLGTLHAVALCASMWTAGRDDVVEARLKVNNSGAERIVAALKATLAGARADIADVRIDPARNELVVKGNAGSIEELREIVRLLDVSPARLRIKSRILRIRQQGGKTAYEPLTETVSLTANNAPIAMSVGDEIWDQTATILPRINGDGSITLRVDFAFAAGGEVKHRPAPLTRRVNLKNTFASVYTDIPMAVGGEKDGFEARYGLGRPQYRIEVQVLDIISGPVKK
jgi:hypothetical protein